MGGWRKRKIIRTKSPSGKKKLVSLGWTTNNKGPVDTGPLLIKQDQYYFFWFFASKSMPTLEMLTETTIPVTKRTIGTRKSIAYLLHLVVLFPGTGLHMLTCCAVVYPIHFHCARAE
jgi:hypothetical protein